jgi:hypothetical protein
MDFIPITPPSNFNPNIINISQLPSLHMQNTRCPIELNFFIDNSEIFDPQYGVTSNRFFQLRWLPAEQPAGQQGHIMNSIVMFVKRVEIKTVMVNKVSTKITKVVICNFSGSETMLYSWSGEEGRLARVPVNQVYYKMRF